MLNSRFRIYFRQRQIQFMAADVVVDCTAGIATYVAGTVPRPTWEEMTDYTDGLDKVSISWSASSAGNSEGGNTTQNGSNYDKGISLELTFDTVAFNYIYDWLVLQPCFVLNAVEVLLVDKICNKSYRVFEIKSDNLTYQPNDEPCVFTVKLREQDLVWHCVHKTMIWDDHQGWFNQGMRDHPCFLTGIEARPRLMQSVRLGLLLFIRAFPIAGLIIAGEDDNKARRILNIENFVPSPLIRDIIQNVCDKCGLTMDTMFDEGETYENLCLYFPSAGYSHHEDGSSMNSPSLDYIFDNRWTITLDEFLDKLKKVFNAEWYVTPNSILIFKPIADFLALTPIYDFTDPASVTLFELTYTFSGEKKPAYGRYQYQTDNDLASMEIEPLYNDLVDYDGEIDNPMLEGERTKGLEFAATGFIRDGRKVDYIDQCIGDARIMAQVLTVALSIIVASLMGGGVTIPAAIILAAFVTFMLIAIDSIRNDWDDLFADWDSAYTGAVRLTAESISAPRLLLWDGVSKERAKVVSQNNPVPNTYYNPGSTPYEDENTINSNDTVFNYPMYFDAHFTENLFDRFHEVTDNPLKNPESYQEFSGYIDLCCEMLDVFGVWEGDYIKIGYIVKIEVRDNYEVFGRITYIEVQYEENKIILRGKIIKKPL